MSKAKRTVAVRSLQKRHRELRAFESRTATARKLTGRQLSAKIDRLNKLRRATGGKGKIEVIVKPGMGNEWITYRKDVIRHGRYGNLIFKGVVTVMNALAQGKTPVEAIKVADNHPGFSNMSWSHTCNTVIHFSPRAREMAQYYKKMLLAEGIKPEDLKKYIPDKYL